MHMQCNAYLMTLALELPGEPVGKLTEDLSYGILFLHPRRAHLRHL